MAGSRSERWHDDQPATPATVIIIIIVIIVIIIIIIIIISLIIISLISLIGLIGLIIVIIIRRERQKHKHNEMQHRKQLHSGESKRLLLMVMINHKTSIQHRNYFTAILYLTIN